MPQVFNPKKAGETANRLIQELNQQKAEGIEQEALQAEPPSEQPQTPLAAEEQPQDSSDTIAQADSTATQSVQPNEPEKGEDASGEEIALLRQQLDAADKRWKVLKGMISKKDEQIEDMRHMVESLVASSAQPAAAEQSASAEPQSFITAEDREEYQPKYIDFVERVSRSVMQKELAKFEQRLGKMESSVTGVRNETATTAKQTFITTLKSLAPQVGELNNDPLFLDWLQVVEPIAGQTRQQLLTDAVSRLDATRAAYFFNAYAAEQQPSTPSAAAPTSPSTAAPAAGRAGLVAPGKPHSATPSQDSKNGRIWTPDMIKRLYEDKRKRRISGKEFDSLERDLIAAQGEGRYAP
jgi:hypothetical protein